MNGTKLIEIKSDLTDAQLKRAFLEKQKKRLRRRQRYNKSGKKRQQEIDKLRKALIDSGYTPNSTGSITITDRKADEYNQLIDKAKRDAHQALKQLNSAIDDTQSTNKKITADTEQKLIEYRDALRLLQAEADNGADVSVQIKSIVDAIHNAPDNNITAIENTKRAEADTKARNIKDPSQILKKQKEEEDLKKKLFEYNTGNKKSFTAAYKQKKKSALMDDLFGADRQKDKYPAPAEYIDKALAKGLLTRDDLKNGIPPPTQLINIISANFAKKNPNYKHMPTANTPHVPKKADDQQDTTVSDSKTEVVNYAPEDFEFMDSPDMSVIASNDTPKSGPAVIKKGKMDISTPLTSKDYESLSILDNNNNNNLTEFENELYDLVNEVMQVNNLQDNIPKTDVEINLNKSVLKSAIARKQMQARELEQQNIERAKVLEEVKARRESITNQREELKRQKAEIKKSMKENKNKKAETQPLQIGVADGEFDKKGFENLLIQLRENSAKLKPVAVSEKNVKEISNLEKRVNESLDKVKVDKKDLNYDPSYTGSDSSDEEWANGEPYDNEVGLSNYQILDIMAPYVREGFLGVFSINNLHKALKQITPDTDEFSVIINTQPSTSKIVGHWVALYGNLTDQGSNIYSLCYYDSLAHDPPAEVLKFLSDVIQITNPPYYCDLKINKIVQQRKGSLCGFYAMKFVIDMIADKKFREITGYNDVRKSKQKILKFKNELLAKGDLTL